MLVKIAKSRSRASPKNDATRPAAPKEPLHTLVAAQSLIYLADHKIAEYLHVCLEAEQAAVFDDCSVALSDKHLPVKASAIYIKQYLSGVWASRCTLYHAAHIYNPEASGRGSCADTVRRFRIQSRTALAFSRRSSQQLL